MERKSYKWLHILLGVLLLISVSYFLIGCKTKNSNIQPNYFNEIVEFVKANGEHESQEVMYLLEEDSSNQYELYITYDKNNNSLQIAGSNSTLKEFIVSIPESNNYAQVTNYTCIAATEPPKNLTTNFKLPTTPFKDNNTTVKLPNFELTSQDNQIITEQDKAEVRKESSQALNKAFARFDNFFVEKIKNNDKNFVNTMYSHFYLPNIQAEL